MSLCYQCGKIADHAKGCGAAPPGAFDAAPTAKNERALAALAAGQDEQKRIASLVGADPRGAAKALFLLETRLEKAPPNDLSSFEQKRNYRALEEQLKKLKGDIEAALDSKVAEALAKDMAFARRALELLHGTTRTRRELGLLELSELAKLPELGFDPAAASDPTDPAAAIRTACEAIERRLASTQGVDPEVDAWGRGYLEALAAGEAPREWPAAIERATFVPTIVVASGLTLTLAGAGLALGAGQHVAGGGIAVAGLADLAVGATLLARAAARRRAAPATFASLSQRFRERLYLVCALRSLRGILSAHSKAEEAFRAHAGGTENAARWKKIKTQEKDVVKALAGEEWDEARAVDDEMARRLQAAGVLASEAIRAAADLTRDDWDGLAKAYQIERREEAGPADEARLATLAQVVLASAGSREDAAAERARAIADARAVFAGGRAARGHGAPSE